MSNKTPPPPRGTKFFLADAVSKAAKVPGDYGLLTQPWSGWFRSIFNVLRPGISVTVTLAKLTGGGANGSLTITNGIVTAYVAPT